MTDATILHVDPAGMSEELRGELAGQRGLDVVSRGSIDEARAVLGDTDVACVVTEYGLPDGTGVDLVEHVRETTPDTGCVLYTDADRHEVEEAVSGLVAEYVSEDSTAAVERVAQLVRTTVERRSQTTYPLPDTETERLETLEGLSLDDPALQESLSRVTDLATARYDLPLSAVSVVTDHTQEFLVCEGADWEPIQREGTICTYTVLDEGVTVVEDVREDPRFATNEGLVDLGIRFYAGATLTLDGYPIGTICVYGESPREFSDAETAYLELLAEEASAWIDCYGRDRSHPTTGTAGTVEGEDR